MDAFSFYVGSCTFYSLENVCIEMRIVISSFKFTKPSKQRSEKAVSREPHATPEIIIKIPYKPVNHYPLLGFNYVSEE